MNNEIKKIITEGHLTEVDYPFTTKPIFSTLGSIIETSRQETLISFTPIESTPDLLGFIPSTIYKQYNLSPNPVDILSFDSLFHKIDIAQGLTFKGKRSRIIHNFTMDVDP